MDGQVQGDADHDCQEGDKEADAQGAEKNLNFKKLRFKFEIYNIISCVQKDFRAIAQGFYATQGELSSLTFGKMTWFKEKMVCNFFEMFYIL